MSENDITLHLSDYCEPETARHDLCTDGGCACGCHLSERQPRIVWANGSSLAVGGSDESQKLHAIDELQEV